MRQHHHLVLGQVQIRLHGVRADGHGGPEGIHGVLGVSGAVAAVADGLGERSLAARRRQLAVVSAAGQQGAGEGGCSPQRVCLCRHLLFRSEGRKLTWRIAPSPGLQQRLGLGRHGLLLVGVGGHGPGVCLGSSDSRRGSWPVGTMLTLPCCRVVGI